MACYSEKNQRLHDWIEAMNEKINVIEMAWYGEHEGKIIEGTEPINGKILWWIDQADWSNEGKFKSNRNYWGKINLIETIEEEAEPYIQ